MCALIWEPSPSMNLPELSDCKSLATVAMLIGLRANATAMAVPMARRGVCSAANSTGRNGSRATSVDQTPAYPIRSASASCLTMAPISPPSIVPPTVPSTNTQPSHSLAAKIRSSVRAWQWCAFLLCRRCRLMSASSMVAGQKPSSAANSRSLSVSIVIACAGARPRTGRRPARVGSRIACSGDAHHLVALLGHALRQGTPDSLACPADQHRAAHRYPWAGMRRATSAALMPSSASP